jgi:CheY-like chemotaxis protein
MDLSALELGDCRLHKMPFSLLEELNYVMMLVKQAAPARGLHVEWYHQQRRIHGDSFKIEFAPLRVNADPHRIDQVLFNILSNALKFTPAGGKVVLETTIVAEDEISYKMQLSVKDTGIGISPSQQHRIFRMFTQADEGFSRKYGGTGSGLYISQRLIHLMGGRVTVQSELGKGANFRILVRFLKYHGVLSEEQLQVEHGERANIPGFLIESLSSSDMLKVLSGGLQVRDQEKEREIMKVRKLEKAERKLKRQRTPPSLSVVTLSVLLAEDNPVNQQVGIKLLRMLGIRDIDLAIDGKECVEKVKERWAACSHNSHGSDNSAVVRAYNDNSNDSNSNNNNAAVPLAALTTATSTAAMSTDAHIKIMKTSQTTVSSITQTATTTTTTTTATQTRMYDLILMDKQMPNMDGVEATVAIRKLEAEFGLRRTLIVALTADCRIGSDVELLSCGMDDVLTKPIRAGGLKAALTKYGLLRDVTTNTSVG